MARINWKEEFATILDIEAMSARDRNVVEDIKKGLRQTRARHTCHQVARATSQASKSEASNNK